MPVRFLNEVRRKTTQQPPSLNFPRIKKYTIDSQVNPLTYKRTAECKTHATNNGQSSMGNFRFSGKTVPRKNAFCAARIEHARSLASSVRTRGLRKDALSSLDTLRVGSKASRGDRLAITFHSHFRLCRGISARK